MKNSLPVFDLDFNFFLGKPDQTAIFRQSPSDFIVDEQLNCEFSGEGEHHYIHIKKTGENTQFVASQLAQFLKVKPMNVSFAGMKDRHAITTQWFSVQLPGKALALDWSQFRDKTNLNVELLAYEQHHKKLRRGDHCGNRFAISLRELKQTDSIEERLNKIKEFGVPNYYGEQRFGFSGQNLIDAQAMFVSAAVDQKRRINRNKKSILLSAARSYLFNCVLSERVEQGTWLTMIEGEPSDTPSAPLWGRGRNLSQGETLEVESQILANLASWCDSLEHSGLSQERRALQLIPKNFSWQWHGTTLILNIDLLPGQYATSVLRELSLLDNRSINKRSCGNHT